MGGARLMRKIEKLLVANRGEIACRVISSARAKGYRTVAVFSEADADARHVRLADEAVCIGPAPVGQSYLSIDNVLAAAKRTGADAIHPGYGFLSERADFAEACAQAGIVFVGPSPEAIRVMGDKAASKHRMLEAGVPCIPGYHGENQDEATMIREAENIGYPVMVKASAGGGGRGMRVVSSPADLPAALRTARSEAQAAFGDGRLLLEHAVIGPRHVEIQVFGDAHGNIVHLGERDCSVQRRHQKVIEEAPSPAVDAALRVRMGEAAVRVAASIGYIGAGTVEFLLSREGAFYFLEMNTRLQVEHPVTELVTGLDLVALQLDVAEGKALPFGQEDVRLDGHAIEARLYAEDPAGGFLPQTGQVRHWSPACGDGVRIDHGLHNGAVVSPFYDPMLAKIIAWGQTRDEALARLRQAVEETRVHGVTTNRSFLASVLGNAEFMAGGATTAFIAAHYPDGFSERAAPPESYLIAACLLAERAGGGWSNSVWPAYPLRLDGPLGEKLCTAQRRGGGWRIAMDSIETHIIIRERTESILRIEIDGDTRTLGYWLFAGKDAVEIDMLGQTLRFDDLTYRPAKVDGDEESSGAVLAPMNGMVAAIHIEKGCAVKRGDLLMVVEAMKMEHQIVAPVDGVVTDVFAVPGAQVAVRDTLLVVTAEAAA
jgi:geranyl-CoA carboxylase alpha subunit